MSNTTKDDKSGILSFEQTGLFFHKKSKQQLGKANYIDALIFARKAVQKEPDNALYLTELAELYAECGFHELSNCILLNLIARRQIINPEAFFSVGMNFLGMQEFDHAFDAFEEYLEISAYDSEYIEEAEGFLSMMSDVEFIISDDFRLLDDDEKHDHMAMIEKCRGLMSLGKYEEAVELLQDLTIKYPGALFAKNNLALAYYCINNNEKAIFTALDILRISPNNIDAHCNLVIFYNETGDKKKCSAHLKRALELTPDVDEYYYKVALTLCQIKEDKLALQRLNILSKIEPCVRHLMHYTAVANYNTGNYKCAANIWRDMSNIDSLDSISAYYLAQCTEKMAGSTSDMIPDRFEYLMEVPLMEAIFRIQTLKSISIKPRAETADLFNQNDFFTRLLVWAMDVYDPDVQSCVLKLLGDLPIEISEQLIKLYILKHAPSDEFKDKAAYMLYMNFVPLPYMARMDNQILEIRFDRLNLDAPKRYNEQVIWEQVLMSMEIYDAYSDRHFKEAKKALHALLGVLYHKRTRLRSACNFAATIERFVCENNNILHENSYWKRQYAHVTNATLNRYWQQLSVFLYGN